MTGAQIMAPPAAGRDGGPPSSRCGSGIAVRSVTASRSEAVVRRVTVSRDDPGGNMVT